VLATDWAHLSPPWLTLLFESLGLGSTCLSPVTGVGPSSPLLGTLMSLPQIIRCLVCPNNPILDCHTQSRKFNLFMLENTALYQCWREQV
jgi:hypothetical protein